jgi:hypothetical protein
VTIKRIIVSSDDVLLFCNKIYFSLNKNEALDFNEKDQYTWLDDFNPNIKKKVEINKMLKYMFEKDNVSIEHIYDDSEKLTDFIFGFYSQNSLTNLFKEYIEISQFNFHLFEKVLEKIKNDEKFTNINNNKAI